MSEVKKNQFYFQLRENAFVMAESHSRKNIEKILQENFGLPSEVIDDVLKYQSLPVEMKKEILRVISEIRNLKEGFGESVIDMEPEIAKIKKRYEGEMDRLGSKIYEIKNPNLNHPVKKTVMDFSLLKNEMLGADGLIIYYREHRVYSSYDAHSSD